MVKRAAQLAAQLARLQRARAARVGSSLLERRQALCTVGALVRQLLLAARGEGSAALGAQRARRPVSADGSDHVAAQATGQLADLLAQQPD